MADSNVHPKVPVDGPLEQALYIGTMLRGILYGQHSCLKHHLFGSDPSGRN